MGESMGIVQPYNSFYIDQGIRHDVEIVDPHPYGIDEDLDIGSDEWVSEDIKKIRLLPNKNEIK